MSACGFSTMPLPELGGAEADARRRAALVRVGGQPQAVPLSVTMAKLIKSWYAPLTVGDLFSLYGFDGGQRVQVTVLAVRDRLQRTGILPQLGAVPTNEDLFQAVKALVLSTHAEAEREAVAADQEADERRAALLEDADTAARRAELLRELAKLDGQPSQTPAEPPPGRSRLRRRG